MCGHHILLANAKIYKMYKRDYEPRYPAKLGYALNSAHTWAVDPNNPAHIEAAERQIQFSV